MQASNRKRPFRRWAASVILMLVAGAALGVGLTRSSADDMATVGYHAYLNGDFPDLAEGYDWASVTRFGAFTDFTPHGTQPGLAVEMESPSGCFGCHRANPSAGPTAPDYMPDNTWGGSMMAHATRDPLFWAALDVANADVPGVGDYCLRCHTPAAWLAGRVSKTGDGGFVDGANGCLLTGDHNEFETTNNDYAGITCHFCHRLLESPADGNTGDAPLGNGNFWIDDATQCVTENGETYFGPCRGGPYRYAANDPSSAPHAWKYSAFHGDSAICGTCHDVTTPDVKDAITGETAPLKMLVVPDDPAAQVPMPIERTYSEWRQSDFSDVVFRDRMGDDFDFAPALARAAGCQDCHMAHSDDPTARACNQTAPGHRADELPVHEFVGANTWIPAILRDEIVGVAGSGITDRVNDLNRTIGQARDMLSRRSARIETVVKTNGTGGLVAEVTVTNLAGHKLPTGYTEGRRMWLHVVATDADANVLWENGAWDPSTGGIDQDEQTKIYEAMQGIWDADAGTCRTEDGQGRKMFHFVLNDCIAKDNRIPPLGFTGGDNVETRPVGYGYPAAPGSGRLVNYDVTRYDIALPPGSAGAVTVTATLRHQIASDDYIHFLKNQSDERNFQPENLMCSTGPGRPFDVGPQDRTRGQYMFDLWSDPAHGRSPPEAMATHAASISLAP